MSLSTNGNHFVTYDVRNDDPDGEILLTEVNVRGSHLVARAFADHLASLEEAWLLSNSPPVVTEFSEYNLTDGDPAPMSARMFDTKFEREL